MRCLMVAAALLALGACGGDRSDPAGADGKGNANAGPAGNAAAPAPETAATGRQYVELAGAGDLYEIEAARLALQKTRRADVRAFAAALLADHQRATAQLHRAAAQARPPIRVAPALNGAQQADMQALQAAGGAVFDPVWLRQQVNAHERAMTLVTSYAATGEVESLRRHAASVAGPIQRHLAHARELEVPAPRAD